MSSSPFGFATRVSLSLSLFSLSSTRISLSSPRVVSALVALDVPPSPPSCRYLPPNIFSISFISSLLPESSPPLEYTLTFYFPLLVVKPTNPPRPFFFLLSCFSYVYPPPLLFVPFLAPRAEGFTSSKQQTERGREGEGRREGEDYVVIVAIFAQQVRKAIWANRTPPPPQREREKVRWITNGPLGGN